MGWNTPRKGAGVWQGLVTYFCCQAVLVPVIFLHHCRSCQTVIARGLCGILHGLLLA